MSPSPPPPPGERLERLSVLQELTVAALDLFDPGLRVDAFLERVAERLGCAAVLWLARGGAGPDALVGAAGLAQASRALPPPGPGQPLPYPELAEACACWELDLGPAGARPGAARHALLVCFGPGRPAPEAYRPVAERLAGVVRTALAHRELLADLRQSYAELARAQAALVERERLAALGELAAVMAHEVRNPLGVIFNLLSGLRREGLTDAERAPLVQVAQEEAERLNKLVGDLLDFARPLEAELRPVKLEEVAASALAAVRAAQPDPERVRMRLEAAPLAPVEADARLLRQALVNLVQNAAQAVGPGGAVTVRLAAEPGGARVEVDDDGPGIREELRHRVFEPFFTTRAQGTGLGLAIVKRIVERHGGQVGVGPRPGGGTRVTVRLPVRS